MQYPVRGTQAPVEQTALDLLVQLDRFHLFGPYQYPTDDKGKKRLREVATVGSSVIGLMAT